MKRPISWPPVVMLIGFASASAKAFGPVGIPVGLSPHVARNHAVLTLDHPSDGAFGELSRRNPAATVANGKLEVDLSRYPASKDRVVASHLRCSFFVDCDDAGVSGVAARIRVLRRPGDTARFLTEFVSGFIERKTMDRIFDPASMVVRKREGDCSEHAMPLTALARTKRIPACVVLGIALHHVAGQAPVATGHAWTEIWYAGRWAVHDAAQHGASMALGAPAAVRYLPIMILIDESPSYRLQPDAMLLPEILEIALPMEPGT